MKRPVITVEEAVAELDAMIGLAPVKEHVRSFVTLIEAARRRALAGVRTEKPMLHLVFTGPPGTGKTTVAAIVAKIFYAFGLLETPAIVEARRMDLVGGFPGADRGQDQRAGRLGPGWRAPHRGAVQLGERG